MTVAAPVPGAPLPETNALLQRSTMVRPSAAGDRHMDAGAFIASILSPAPPLPPEMIAPAWPMRRPGGAAARR